VIPVLTIYNSAQQLTMAGVWIAALGIVGLLIRQAVPWRKQASDAEARLRDALIERVDKLERAMERQQKTWGLKEARHAAERALGNHKLRNMTANFDAILMMLEMNPDRGPDIVAAIKKQRAAQMLAEAKESAVINAAEITASTLDAEEEAA